ncbi:hypothetical protein OHA21_19170 [Actinoplanes sp. NBC_00393]|uniref:hypothetical protein n=1 Tax=Actinoplanes sp. NBC_00393 TaxID=2975953 RepID=UPI002E23F189
MVGPILTTMELKRMPFARRPIAMPGTILVFQMPDNQLVAPQPPYTTGETWWKGPKLAYVVDNRPHGGVFDCKLPAQGDSLFFEATVRFIWRVTDPVQVVHEQVEDPEAECRTYLEQNLPMITRRHRYNRPDEAEADVVNRIGRRLLPLQGRGIGIEAAHAQLLMPEAKRATFEELHSAEDDHELAMLKARHADELEALKRKRMHEVVQGGPEALYAFVLKEDPGRGMEIVTQMQAMADRDKQRAIEAIKVLIDGEEIRLGELDGAVAAAVEGFRNILGSGTAKPALSAGDDDDGAGPA